MAVENENTTTIVTKAEGVTFKVVPTWTGRVILRSFGRALDAPISEVIMTPDEAATLAKALTTAADEAGL